MSEREEMNERIKAAQGALPPPVKPKAVEEGKVETFQCVIGPTPAIYRAWDSAAVTPGGNTYGLLTAPEYIPAHLRDYVRVQRQDPPLVAVGGGRMRPMVVPQEPAKIYLDTLLMCAKTANIEFDELLAGLPVEVAVRPWSFEGRMSPLSGARHQTHRRLHLMAIRIDTELMAKRYDELCAKYFTGG